jgi:hypothetical protein
MLLATKPANSLHAIRTILLVLISFILSCIGLGACCCILSNANPQYLCHLCCVGWMFLNPSALILLHCYCVSSDRKAMEEIKHLFQIFILAVQLPLYKILNCWHSLKPYQIMKPILYYTLSL